MSSKKKRQSTQSLSDVAENVRLDADRAEARRKERAEKYPMCEKLSDASDERRTVNDFLEWLRGKGIWLCDRDEGSNFAVYSPITTRDDDLVLEYLEIDPKKLEEERRAMVDALQEKAG